MAKYADLIKMSNIQYIKDTEGEHCYIPIEEIDTLARDIKRNHSEHLAQYGVKLPGESSIKLLHLVYLRKYIRIGVNKDTISTFVRSIDKRASHDQQIRHLAEDGWYVINRGEPVPGTDKRLRSGYHMLFDIKIPKPTFLHQALKRAGRISAQNFEQLKAIFNYKCATCGAQEGASHPRFRDKIVQLQQGHMDPNKKLTLANTIPQCQVCNQAIYKDFFVLDENGHPVAINNAHFILRSSKKVQEEMREMLTNSNNQADEVVICKTGDGEQ